MSLKKYRQDILRAMGNILLHKALNILCSTLKLNIRNSRCLDEFLEGKKNFVLAFWHGSMLVPWYVNRNKGFSALVSQSKDGAMLFNVLSSWNYKVIRGSSHRGGREALHALIDLAKNHSPIAITPDGPKGPYHKLKPGAVIVAKKSGVPLVLLGIGYSRPRRLKSWDRFEIPRLFSRVNLVYSDPVYIDGNLSFEETQRIIENCELKLNQLQKEAGNF